MNNRLFFLLLLVNLSITLSCQEKNSSYFIGLNYGQASINNFILNDTDYDYHNSFFKIQVNYLLSRKNKWNYELTIEPSVYFVKHQLLNKFFVTPDIPNYIELQKLYTQRKHFNEYALNIGILLRYSLFQHLSIYAQGSVGPMISTKDTERLKKGFAFSDILGFGISYQQHRLRFDIRCTLRHNSNLDLAFPNSGHNSAGIETGISFILP